MDALAQELQCLDTILEGVVAAKELICNNASEIAINKVEASGQR